MSTGIVFYSKILFITGKFYETRRTVLGNLLKESVVKRRHIVEVKLAIPVKTCYTDLILVREV